ncbi:hypothetical protein [Bradyrhizobium iriomotense]|nr:hypothetical protein [Bradyrhizobium iriomotense]
MIKFFLPAVLLTLSMSAHAGGAAQPSQSSSSNLSTAGNSRFPVATQPNSNPFRNPIAQGAPPAVSANPAINSNQTNVRAPQ